MNDRIALVEDRLRRLPGVVEARIQTDASGRPVAVQLRALEGEDATRLRDQSAAACAADGFVITPGAIHITFEPALADGELEELEVEGRIRLVAYQLRVDDVGAHAEVELELGTHVVRGMAQARGGAPATDLLAQACLDALERLCHARVAFRLAGVQRAALPTGDVVCVAVQEIDGRTSRVHTGIAPTGDDPARATAYAALHALNRRFGRILTGPTRHTDIA